ncbi:Precursor of CEP3 [Hirschfeldia incana]|nr:Precursor of CEP3 [Hirschfeldia incana]
MARINVYLFAFMLLLTIKQEYGSVEGRTLTKSSMVTVEKIGADGSVSMLPPAEPFHTPPNHGVDTFRPTVPGHSPGIGHSVHN